MSSSAYAPLTSAEQIFYDLIWTPMLTLGENWLELEVPFLDLPIIKQLDEGTIKIVTDAFYHQLVLIIDVTAIKLVNTIHQAAYDSAFENLAVVIDENGVGSDAYKTAQTNALAALSRFSHIGP